MPTKKSPPNAKLSSKYYNLSRLYFDHAIP